MMKGMMVNGKKYRDKVKPVFNTMGWEAEIMALPPEDNIIVHSVMRPKIGGGRERVSEIAVKDVIDGCLGRTGVAPEQKAAELTLLEMLTPINAAIYSKYLQPYFDRLRWSVERHHNEFGGVVITGAKDEHGNSVDEDALVFAARKAMPGIDPPGIPAKEEPDRSSPPDEGLKIYDGAFLDYIDIMKRPENAENLKVYAINRLTIHRNALTDVVRPAFAAKGWIYGGNHYGDGAVEVQSVLDNEERVVPLDEVLQVLGSLGVKYTVQPPEMGFGMDLETDEDLGPEIGERSPGEFDQDELNRQQAAEAAMKEEEESEEKIGGALVLQDDDSLGVRAEYSVETNRITVEFHIGENIISVECNAEQLTGFILTAYGLSHVRDAAERHNTKEATKDERCQSEENSG